MRIFKNMVEAVKEVERDLWEMGVNVKTKSVQDLVSFDGYDSKEITAYSFTVLDGSDWSRTFDALGFQDPATCAAYVDVEYRDRFEPDEGQLFNPGRSWMIRKEIWQQYLHQGRFAYTYSERIHMNFSADQEKRIMDLHTHDPQSRQLIYSIYDHHIDDLRRGGLQRIPCTMYYQLLDRGDDLILIHNMRSCDLYKHFPIDLALAWKTCERHAILWEKKPRVIMQIGSLHAFNSDMEKRKIF
jgi:thymidylate synthase